MSAPTGNLPSGIGKPAQRALTAAGYTRLEQLAEVSEAELGMLHGMGPKALGILRQALEAEGMSFQGVSDLSEHDQPQADANQAGEFWIDASVPDDEEVPDVLVGVTARESDALEHLHLLLLGQGRYKLAVAVGQLLLRIRERQAKALPPAEIKQGIPPKTPSDPLEDLRLGPWEEDWERW